VAEQELISDLAGAQAVSEEWDALAVRASKPVVSPWWVLPWWRHVAPDLQARIVAVRSGGTLIGLAPFYVAGARMGVAEYRLMADDFGVCMEPLALPGREWDVAAAIACALHGADPPVGTIGFGPMALASGWTEALAQTWQGRLRPLSRTLRLQTAPVIVLEQDSYEDWLATLGSKLRRDLRRSERLFAEAGGSTRWSDTATLPADAASFARLHGSRWEGRGWSRLADLGPRLPDWLADVGEHLIEDRRLGLCVLEVAGEAVCVDLHLSAGSRVEGINVGWDEQWARIGPAKLALLRVVQQAFATGRSRIGLGTGGLANKLRISSGEEPVAWSALVPPSRRYLQGYATILPGLARMHARESLTRALPPPWLARLQSLRGGGS
jgi:CelD/BcsL family acetyltransferase involved in cellulose biosynthesis